MEDLTDEQLGQVWADKFVWYLMEMMEGRTLLYDEAHMLLVGELRKLDEEMRRRGLPANRRYIDAFEQRRLLPEDEMRRLSIRIYGRAMTCVGIQEQS